MRTDTTSSQTNSTSSRATRPTWRTLVMALMMLTGAFSLTGIAVPTAAQASTMVVDQCNAHGPAVQGATTAMKCTVTVVNTISGTSTYSRTTVTRLCTLGPCSAPNGTFITDSVSLVTVIRQCNNSDNDTAHAITCYVNVVNNIGRDTPDAQPVTPSAVNQCVGSGTGGGGALNCKPATAAGTTLTQCNGSGNGGGGKLHCTLDPQSGTSRAIPITVSQCNGTGNVGGASVTCNASVITRIISLAPVAVPTPTATASQTETPATATTPTATPSQRTPALSGLAQTGAASSGGTDHSGLVMLIAGLVLLAAIGALLYRRYAPDDLFARFSRKG